MSRIPGTKGYRLYHKFLMAIQVETSEFCLNSVDTQFTLIHSIQGVGRAFRGGCLGVGWGFRGPKPTEPPRNPLHSLMKPPVYTG